ncbi:Component of the septin ring, required for cytokinesis [Komagataella phaffii CBS 7435]|uniref:Cell division control protein 10 n=2 Tax=Komagataella phaffii TaxID=460519 RepID=C4R940_KOMPG|nr:Component of the septin ring of the mother-bud neck that is required for cytokinesis [Komagataella phaffii GS115]AOA64897.1 GQ67_05239T0 [Komagataella phaffii]CAH2450474.1 Component of the septin ring, required for cytokinesis [Komagataella phaffii CBS 7435]AOA69451.1 GQ68_05221T0 [Komagataella phaffii GS115]CAY72115.1 Component of the septin ring of the mother-bud neck that is required for cytokinesis [Komagataella phaffii GS115]CCA40281.1 Component of the septin ring, required for cytokin
MASQVVQPKNYVGFDTITTQIENRLLKRGFELNVMLVGQSGLGKSTLVNTLFATHLVDSNGRKSTFEPVERTVEIKSTSQILNENNVNLKLNVIDTPGFGDQINNDKCWEPILQYIKEQNSTYLRKELTAQRERYIPDTRVHCVLYFIQPNGKGLRNLDIQVLSKLTTVVNVIPVIAKADTLTTEERTKFKSILHTQFEKHDLNFFPYDNEDLSEEELTLNQDIRSLLPFAVIGSENEISTIDGQVIRGRRTRWGLINVEDVTQCEFVYLRDFLTRTHLHDLIETTSVVHYETYRSKQLIALKEKNGQRVSNATMQ